MHTKIARNILLIIAGIIVVVGAVAIEPFIATKSVVCADPRSMFESISNHANEAPVWSGRDINAQYLLLENQKTKAWTMIYYDTNLACVVASGLDATPIFPDR